MNGMECMAKGTHAMQRGKVMTQCRQWSLVTLQSIDCREYHRVRSSFGGIGHLHHRHALENFVVGSSLFTHTCNIRSEEIAYVSFFLSSSTTCWFGQYTEKMRWHGQDTAQEIAFHFFSFFLSFQFCSTFWFGLGLVWILLDWTV